MNRDATITVVTVTFNCVKTIGDTLCSVRDQVGVKVQHVVVDGGSTDGTREVIAQFPHVAVFISELDDGIYDALNKGIQLAKGAIVGILHADDVFHDEFVLSKVVRAFAQDEIDVVYGDLVYVRRRNTAHVVRKWKSSDFDRRFLRRGWMPPHPTLFARRRLYRELGGFDTQYRIAADYDMMLRVFTRPAAGSKYIPEVLVRMRIGGASNGSLRNLLRKSREDLRIVRKHRIGGFGVVVCKQLSKIGQFISRNGQDRDL